MEEDKKVKVLLKYDMCKYTYDGKHYERCPGITILLNGKLQEYMDVLMEWNPEYENYVYIMKDILFAGLEVLAERYYPNKN